MKSVCTLTIKKNSFYKKLTLTILTCFLLTSAWIGYSQTVPRSKSHDAVIASHLGSYKTSTQKPSKRSVKKNAAIKGINPRVYQLASKAHDRARELGLAKKPVVTIIDYSLPSTQPRLWVVDMAKNKIIFHTHVAHGSGSGGNTAKAFSNVPGSLQSSLGVFVTGKTYQGKHGLSLTLHGLEKGINNNAQRRRIVMHGANYVNKSIIRNMGRLGRSWGCPAVSNQLSTPIIQTIKDGSLIFAYYPDKKWLDRSQFLT